MKYARRLRFFLWFCVIALVLASAGYLLKNPGRKLLPAPVKTANVEVEQAEVVIDGFTFSKTEDDESSWELNAKKAEVSKKTGIAKLEDLDAVIKTADGTVFKLKAGQGMFDTGTKKMELKGDGKDIVVTSSNGYRMKLKDVSWDNTKKELSTNNSVTIDGGGVMIEGKGMVAKTDKQEVRIVDGVRTVFNPSR